MSEFDTNRGKQRALELLIENPMMDTDVLATQVGVSVRTIQRWKREPDFANELVKGARSTLHSNIHLVYAVALEKTLAGDHRWAKILLDHVEKIEELSKELTQEHTFNITWKRHDDDKSAIIIN